MRSHLIRTVSFMKYLTTYKMSVYGYVFTRNTLSDSQSCLFAWIIAVC